MTAAGSTHHSGALQQMFLFTTPSPTSSTPPPASGAGGASATAGGQPVVDAIRQGAQQSGVSFDYLLRTAKRESALDPSARAPTSSATGLFQFIEQTWLGLVKNEGDKLGLGAQASAVTPRGDGTYTVAAPSTREAILKLREDPQLSARLAGALTQQNRDALAGALGREPTSGELYMAHVLGARGATNLISAAIQDPARPATVDFPDAARANRGIFYERSGRVRSVSEVYAALSSGATEAEGAIVGPRPIAAQAGTAGSPGTPDLPLPSGLTGMFQTGGRPGPISDAVAKIWRVNNEGGRARTGAATPFFPRSGDADRQASSDPAPAPDKVASAQASGPAEAADLPLPPGLRPPLPPMRPAAVEAFQKIAAARTARP